MAFVLAPVGGTWLYEEYGYRALWWTCGMLGLVLWGAFSLLSLAVKKQRLVLAEQLTPVSSQMLES
jgi:MFS family permease